MKRGEGSFTLKPGEKETLSMEVSPESYMDKVTTITSPPSYLISSDLTRSHATSPDLTQIQIQMIPGGGHVPDEEQLVGDGGRDWPILECGG